MHDITNERSKMANQAWRKRPRKFASKSRLGCKTCKIRRVKCDLSRPSCLKCRSTGRTCDGYGAITSALQAQETVIDAYQLHQWHTYQCGLVMQDLGPFMVLPMAGPARARAMAYFEHTSIKHLNAYLPCESWRKTLMFFSQTVPAVRHAAMALASMHRYRMDHDSSDDIQPSSFFQGTVQHETPLFHYNRAIQLLLNQEGGDPVQTTAVTLLVSYLFTCFDYLACNYIQAFKHLRGGVELSRTAYGTDDAAKSSGIGTMIGQVARQIRRLDLQAVMFLVDWTPAVYPETLISQLPPCGGAFQSLEEAADRLQILVSLVMSLRNTEQQTSTIGQVHQSPSSPKYTILGQLQAWSSCFERTLQLGDFYESDPETNRLTPSLRLQYAMALILLNTQGSGREMDYDDFLPQFRRCVTLAGNVVAAQERYTGSLQPTFTPEVGIVPVLYMIGLKCRHATVRRKVLGLLRRQSIKEAVWDSISAARVVERVIEIEEGGMAWSMEQIPDWQRIETLSWVHVVEGQSAGRLDVEYTFCGQEGTYTEFVIL